MVSDRLVGGGVFAGSIAGVVAYGLLIFYWPTIMVQLTAFVGVALPLGMLAWIGYTMATAPAPEPMTDFPGVSAEPKADPEKEKSAQGTYYSRVDGTRRTMHAVARSLSVNLNFASSNRR